MNNFFFIFKRQQFVVLVLLFLVTRLTNLTKLPIFNDEAIYLDWGQKMLKSNGLFLSLFDGKSPLLMWVFGLFIKFLPDPLFAGRLVSVFFGLLSLLGIQLLAKKYLSNTLIWIPGLLYIFSPLFVFFDRQALMESAISALSIWSFYFLIKQIKNPSLKEATVIGILWSLGIWIKINFVIFVTVSLIIVLILKRKMIKEIGGYFLYSLGLCLICLLPLMVQKDALNLWTMNNRFSLSFFELISVPFITWARNIFSILDIGFWQVFGLLIILNVVVFRNFKKIYTSDFDKSLVIWIVTCLCVYTFLVRSANPRYLISFLPLVCLVMAKLLNQTKKLGIILLTSTLIGFVYLDLLILFNPLGYFRQLAQVSKYSQISEYTRGFSSGYGVIEATDYLLKKIGDKKVIVGTRLDAGNPESSISLYLSKYPNIQVVFLDSRSVELPKDKDYIVSKIPIYFASRDKHLAGLDRFLILEKEFCKLDKEVIGIYRVKTN